MITQQSDYVKEGGGTSGSMLFQMSVLNLDLHYTCRGYSSVAEHSTADREVTSSTLVAP